MRTIKEGVKYVGATGTATLDKGVKVLVDGKQQTFKNQKGETIYPLFYAKLHLSAAAQHR